MISVQRTVLVLDIQHFINVVLLLLLPVFHFRRSMQGYASPMVILEGDASPRPEEDASHRPEGDASPSLQWDTTTRPEGYASPSLEGNSSPRPEEDASPTLGGYPDLGNLPINRWVKI